MLPPLAPLTAEIIDFTGYRGMTYDVQVKFDNSTETEVSDIRLSGKIDREDNWDLLLISGEQSLTIKQVRGDADKGRKLDHDLLPEGEIPEWCAWDPQYVEMYPECQEQDKTRMDGSWIFQARNGDNVTFSCPEDRSDCVANVT